jgi:AbrB family looped-hinge helix DNA binding protein
MSTVFLKYYLLQKLKNVINRLTSALGIAKIFLQYTFVKEDHIVPSVTISSKRQITIPAEIFRLLELKEGQKLMVEVDGDRIILKIRPINLTQALSGVTHGLYGNNSAQIDEYIEKERSEWQG